MVPEFPNFTQLQTDYIKDIKKLIQSLPEYSDYNPASLVAWDIHQDTEISNLHGNLVVIFSDYMDGSKFISLHGTQKIRASMKAVFRYAANNNLEPMLKLIPEETAMLALQTRDYSVSEDPDNHDYLISLENIAEVPGRRFRNVRRQIKTFLHEYGLAAHYTPLDLGNSEHIREILSVFDTRESQKPDNDDESEQAALKRLLEHQEHFQLSIRGVRIHGMLEAFIILEKSTEHLVGHFWKANTHYSGIYHYLLHSCSKEFYSRGFTEMNIEQDLGIKGLRTAKELLQPRYLKKYSISQPVLAQQTAQVATHPQQLTLSLQL